MIGIILFGLINSLAMGTELKISVMFTPAIHDKSIKPARAFSTQNVRSSGICVIYVYQIKVAWVSATNTMVNVSFVTEAGTRFVPFVKMILEQWYT